MIIIENGKRFDEFKFQLEADFENEVYAARDKIFGKDTIYIDAKKKIGTQSLGNTIPDGFLFDLSDLNNIEFYIVEVELESHSFFNHIFPQITKFFAFFKNTEKQKGLVEKLFELISTDADLKRRFKSYLGDEEIFKFLNDLVDSSQNILLVIDGAKPELPEITDTYTDTWGKMLRVLVVKKYVNAGNSIISVDPEFENIELTYDEPVVVAEQKATKFSEEMHFERVSDTVKQIYQHIKDFVVKKDDTYILNPQKYYISIRGARNIAFLAIRKKKIRIVVMVPEDQIRSIISNHPIQTLPASVQKFYNGPCAKIDIDSLANIGEVDILLEKAIEAFNE